jgi:hypothetical protein
MTQGGSLDTQGGSSATRSADLKDVPGGRDILEHSPHIVVLVGIDGSACTVSRHRCAWDAQAACNRMALRAASAQIPGMWEVRPEGVEGRVLAGPIPRGVEWPTTSLVADKTVLCGEILDSDE